MTAMMYQSIADAEVWDGKIKNRSKDGSFNRVHAITTGILNSAGKTRHYLAICADTSEGVPSLSPAFHFCSATDFRAASRDLGRHLGKPGEPKSSREFESTPQSPLTIFDENYAA
jgi:hypothetical protein